MPTSRWRRVGTLPPAWPVGSAHVNTARVGDGEDATEDELCDWVSMASMSNISCPPTTVIDDRFVGWQATTLMIQHRPARLQNWELDAITRRPEYRLLFDAEAVLICPNRCARPLYPLHPRPFSLCLQTDAWDGSPCRPCPFRAGHRSSRSEGMVRTLLVAALDDSSVCYTTVSH